MTDKLKTLKDMKLLNIVKGTPSNVVLIEELKAEAIKWVKFYLEGREDALNIKMYEEADKCEHTAGCLINFFNLTEEDLNKENEDGN